MAEAKKPTEPTEPIDLEQLKEELRAQLLEELKGEAAPGGKKEKRTPDPWLEEYVPIELFKDGKEYKDDVFVSVNGENCRIQRGVPVKIKRKFALVLENSQLQDIAAAEFAEARQEEYRKEAGKYNI